VTVFFTTYYMEEAERIAVIDHGRIVAEGTAAALRQQTGGRTLEDAASPRSCSRSAPGCSQRSRHSAGCSTQE
jgi:ABC-2 type transport system ATP-binding protein